MVVAVVVGSVALLDTWLAVFSQTNLTIKISNHIQVSNPADMEDLRPLVDTRVEA